MVLLDIFRQYSTFIRSLSSITHLRYVIYYSIKLLLISIICVLLNHGCNFQIKLHPADELRELCQS